MSELALRRCEVEAIEPAAAGVALAVLGEAANKAAKGNVMLRYRERKAENTIRAQDGDLAAFAAFLRGFGVDVSAEDLAEDPGAWRGVTWGIVEAFAKWMADEGYAAGTINRRLATVRTYARLAAKAGAIDPGQLVGIRAVQGYGPKEAKRLDAKRRVTRRGTKKPAPILITDEQAAALKAQPLDTPQGRRDAVLMALLLDLGLRCGEVAALEVGDVDLAAGTVRVYRPKVDKVQTHRVTADLRRALAAYFESGDAPEAGPLLRKSRPDGSLGGAGMAPRNITKRVRTLGERIGVAGLSAHDCRHYWATRAAHNGTDPFALRDAGGWASLAMPSRYVEAATIANERVRL